MNCEHQHLTHGLQLADVQSPATFTTTCTNHIILAVAVRLLAPTETSFSKAPIVARASNLIFELGAILLSRVLGTSHRQVLSNIFESFLPPLKCKTWTRSWNLTMNQARSSDASTQDSPDVVLQSRETLSGVNAQVCRHDPLD